MTEPAKKQKLEPTPVEAEEDDGFLPAQDVLRVRVVASAADLDDAAAAHAPEYALCFDDEKIAVPPSCRPLTLEVVHAATSLEFCVRPLTATPSDPAVGDALFTLAAALPEAQLASADEVVAAAAAAFDPNDLCGPALSEYARGGRTFDVRCCAMEGRADRVAFAERVQCVSRWHIDGFSYVDLSDERWRLLTVWERETKRFVGGLTLFRFTRFAAGESTLRVRVCQVIVLPTFQGQRHGTALLEAVGAYAAAEGAAEVTVEDPNPKFRLVRDLVDARGCVRLGLLKPTDTTSPPSAEAMAAAAAALRITEAQRLRCYELQQYKLLQGKLKEANDEAAREKLAKGYRLAIKRRLNATAKCDELGAPVRHNGAGADPRFAAAGPSGGGGEGGEGDEPPEYDAAAARKAKLEELWVELEQEYKALAKRVWPDEESS